MAMFAGLYFKRHHIIFILVETINSLYENRNIAVRMKRRIRIFAKSNQRKDKGDMT